MAGKYILATLLGIALFMGSATCVAAQRTVTSRDRESSYKCDTDGVKLEGTLIERMFYGPPGFGETSAKDLRDKVLVLRLTKRITVEPIENAKAKNSTSLNTIRHVRELQLFFLDHQSAEPRKLIGKAVVVVGTLSEAVAPRQYTDVIMDVKTAKLK